MFERANRLGVTLMYDACTTLMTRKFLETYLHIRNPRVRIGYGLICDSLEEAEALEPYQEPSELTNIYGSNKIVADGSNQGFTAYQKEPYCCDTKYNRVNFNFPPFSQLNVPPSEFMKIVKTVVNKDLADDDSCQWKQSNRYYIGSIQGCFERLQWTRKEASH